jgi:hypothetical protein
MIRHDYILRMIMQFSQVLARITGLARADKVEESQQEITRAVQELVGLDPEEACARSEKTLVAKLLESGPTHVIREKCFMLAALLNAAGDNHARDGHADKARAFHLKSLHLMLETLPHEHETVLPEFAPRVEGLLQALNEHPLPLSTLAALMHHFERLGQYDRAETMLFHLRETAPTEPLVHELGSAFYNRLLAKSDEELVRGELPRDEVLEGAESFRTGQGPT